MLDSNAFLKKIQYPSRGVIYDRNGKLLVYNQPAYDITVIMKEITSLDTADLCRTLKITPEFLRKRFKDLKDRRLNPVTRLTPTRSCSPSSRLKTVVSSRKSFSSFPDSTSSGVPSGNITMMPVHISWEISAKCPRRRWKMMNITSPATS